jgi:hypothetical protein
MATIKAYTNVFQSKKLSEILPIESADMIWRYNHNIHTYDDIPNILVVNNWDDDYNKDVPCWSIASLLNVIPYNISFNKAVYRFKLVKFSDHWECYHENFGTVSTEIFKADNPVDVCYELILKLNELKLL